MEKEQQQRYAPELPSDVLTEILSRVPAESLIRFKCVCKNWYELIIDEDFVRSHLEHWKSAAHVLISSDRDSLEPKIYILTLNLEDQEVRSHCDEICMDDCLADALPLQEPRMPVHADLVGFKLHDSCDGLLLLQANGWRSPAIAAPHLLVCNPITKWYMLLPPPPCGSFKISNCRWGIVSDDHVQRYKIIGVQRYRHSESPSDKCFIFELPRAEGQESGLWKDLPAADIAWNVYPDLLPPFLSVGRKVHWLTVLDPCFGKPEELLLLSLDLSTERLTPTKTLNLPEFITDRDTWFLSDRALCFGRIIQSSKEIEVWILEDFDRPVWRKHHVVRNYAQGLGYGSEYCYLRGILYMKEEDELIMRRDEQTFVYKMSSREWRRIVIPYEENIMRSYHRPRHVNSLVGCGPRNRITC